MSETYVITPPARGPVGSSINPLLKVGGVLGIAASSIGFLIFVVGCFGYQAVFVGLPLVPLVMSVPGLVLAVVGGMVGGRGTADADTRVLAAIFTNVLGILIALLEVTVWRDWSVFYHSSQTPG